MRPPGAPRILSIIERLSFSIARNSRARCFFAVFLLAVVLPLVAVIPIALYFLFSTWIVAGATAGAVKG